MNKLPKKFKDILAQEEINFEIDNEEYVHLNFFSNAGEDIHFTVTIKNFKNEIWEYYENFDPNEHVEMWIEAKKNGYKGVPNIRTLVFDADKIDEKLENLAIRIRYA